MVKGFRTTLERITWQQFENKNKTTTTQSYKIWGSLVVGRNDKGAIE